MRRHAGQWLADFCSGAGGFAKGLQDAGYCVLGIDKHPMPRYHGDLFVQADALTVLRVLTTRGRYELPRRLHGGPFGSHIRLSDFVALHASPPCQRWSQSTRGQRAKGKDYPDLITPLRPLLQATGLPYMIECVPEAPLRPDYRLCGCMFGLEIPGVGQLLRPRVFETSWRGWQLEPVHRHHLPAISVCGHGTPAWQRRVTGHIPVAQWREVMQVTWMNRDELGESVPPAYGAFMGQILRAVLREAA